MLFLSRCIFTESQTGKTRLDTHCLFINNKNQAYVEDENYILIEDDIVNFISFNESVSGTTDVLVDA